MDLLPGQNEIGSAVDKLLDRPIVGAEADVLGYGKLAKSLVAAIQSQPNLSSLTLGLDGSWGSGKSSILALMRSSIPATVKSDEIGTVVIPFSPWLITNRTALVSNFFAQISNAIEEAERRIPKSWSIIRKTTRKNLNRARSLLNRFSKVSSILSSAASAFDPTLVSAAATGSLTAIEKLTDGGKAEHTIEEMKSELSRALTEIATADPTFRILVLIDDLDRLDPDDAVEVLRLVKAVGDFPAITYLLAYDKAALAKAIEHSAKVDSGESYLEKIIQFSFKVPPLEPFQLRAWLRGELDTLFPSAINHSSVRASAVLDHWAGRLW